MNDTDLWAQEPLDRTLNLIADKKAYILDIAKQGLSPEDYAHFKDLTDNFKSPIGQKRGLVPKKQNSSKLMYLFYP